MTPRNPLIPQAIDRLLANTDPWLSCDDCFERLDVAVETALGSQTPLPEEVRVHLRACAVCHEEAQSLAALIGEDGGLTSTEALSRLEDVLARN
ncbi:MAG: hypothetical protein ACRDQ1_13460 [Sciscionella sp.]